MAKETKMVQDSFGNELDEETVKLQSKAVIEKHDLDIEDLRWKIERLEKIVSDLQTTSADHETRITALEP